MSLTTLLAKAPDAGGARPAAGRDRLLIGLVNNMPDAALRATERQFCALLAAAAGDRDVSLRFFVLPDMPRGDIARVHIAEHYSDIAELPASGIGGLIVTGTEPRAPRLDDEPYWPSLARLVDWAEHNTVSTIWSCLAAHAAVWHLDRVPRHPFGRKLSGVFECAKVGDHPLLHGMPAAWHVPHSRYNTLPEAALVAAGYEPWTRSPEAGIDLFARRRGSLFLFLQGHPEYDSTALYREYRRDVGRFLAGARDDYPEQPQSCFGPALARALDEFRDRARRERRPEMLEAFPAAGELPQPWAQPARRFYAAWLDHLATEQSARRAVASRFAGAAI